MVLMLIHGSTVRLADARGAAGRVASTDRACSFRRGGSVAQRLGAVAKITAGGIFSEGEVYRLFGLKLRPSVIVT